MTTILYKGEELIYTIFHKQEHQSEIVDTKDVDLALQKERKIYVPPPDHPWRTQPLNPKKGTSLLCQTGDISTLG
jgi:hypothetical protein